ncbi:MAG: hypothetical protein AAF989_01935 [Planctomycetota bacterium]
METNQGTCCEYFESTSGFAFLHPIDRWRLQPVDVVFLLRGGAANGGAAQPGIDKGWDSGQESARGGSHRAGGAFSQTLRSGNGGIAIKWYC